MPRPSRLALIHASLLLFAAAVVARAGEVQLWQRGQWLAKARRQQFAAQALPAPRGDIFDAGGVPLAQSRNMLRLSLAPRELRDRAAVSQTLARLGVAPATTSRAMDPRRPWVVLPGTFPPAAAASLTAVRGVYSEPVLERVYTQREAMRFLVGGVDVNGNPVGGMEQALDSLLRGHDGSTQAVRDARGAQVESPGARISEPEAGDAVVLTINQELQEIAEHALADAVARVGADGGDIVVLDPQDGEIRAVASRREGGPAMGVPAVSEPYEPGSTLKPLVASRLLLLHRAQPSDRVNTENGRYVLEGRTIEDLHKAPSLTLNDVIRLSSNIGIVKFASRLTPREEFETFRDFGFGTPSGVAYPGESGGTLSPPGSWSRVSAASLVMGYELAVTPLQLAAAYVPLANGGDLLEPALVKEIRGPDGTVKYRHTRRVVRRVMTDSVAAVVRNMMVGVVQGGTATDAALRNFTLAGKSGTARRTASRRYAKGHYTASFVGLFPADHPQYVILIKLDNPQGDYYGGKTAAPISKIVLEAALASRDASLDRNALAVSESLVRIVDSAAGTTASGEDTQPAALPAKDIPVVLDVARGAKGVAGPSPRVPTVPDVRGLSIRAAVKAIHAAGLRAAVSGLGAVTGTSPMAGATLTAGAVVTVVSAQ